MHIKPTEVIRFPEGITSGEVAWMVGTILGGMLPISPLLYGTQHLSGTVTLNREAMLRDAQELALSVYNLAQESTQPKGEVTE